MNQPEKRLYPSWRYGSNGQAKIVHDPAEEQALGPGWYKSITEAEKAAAKPKPQPAGAGAEKPAASKRLKKK